MRFPALMTRTPDARALDRDLDRVGALACALIRDLDRARNRAANHDHYYMRDRDLDRAVALDRALDRVRALDRTLDRTLDRDLDRDRARICALVRDLDPDFGSTVGGLYDVCRRLVWTLGAGAPHRTVPAALAARLAHSAVRVLPAGSRSRYDDEFGSELSELAAAGASWQAQVLYAVRLVDRAWVLRAELREATLRRVRS
jgi:hypothetical protein